MANLRGGPDNITAIVVRVSCGAGRGDRTTPWRSVEPDKASPVNPFWWGLMALCAAGRRWCWRSPATTRRALVSVLVGAASGVVALIAGLEPTTAPRSRRPARTLGKGPHATFDCMPNAEAVRTCRATWPRNCARPRATNTGRSIGAHFNGLCESARRAAPDGDYSAGRAQLCAGDQLHDERDSPPVGQKGSAR